MSDSAKSTHPLWILIYALMKQRFWGQVTIKFQDGQPIIVQREEQIKL